MQLNPINKQVIVISQLKEMFQNSFQNGSYFQLYDPKIAQDKLKNLFKISNVHGNNKVFDKDLKTYVLQFTSSTSKITFPKQEKKDLYMIQQYLVFQIYFYPGMAWNMELVVSDLTKTKRRIILSPSANKIQIKPFFVKFPCIHFTEGIWNNFAVDLYSFMEAFKGQTYRSLDNIYITGHFKLRRIYSTNTIPIQVQEQEQHIQSTKTISFLPKNFYFAPGVPYCTKLTKYDGDINFSQINLYQPTEPSTKNNSSYLKSTKNRLSTPKTQTVKSQKIVQSVQNKLRQKQFLANTNGPQIMGRQRRQKYHESSDSQSQVTQNKTPQSSQKGIITKKKLIKTQQMPPKVRSSIQKRKDVQSKQKTKAKLNPWRSNGKRSQTSKIDKKVQHEVEQSDRNIESPQTSLFKTNQKNKFNESINKGFDRKSDHYSQSEYIQLSQKFSTLTDGKFFKNQSNQPSYLNQHHQNQEYNPDQIQQNIQMESNSMYSTSNRKQQKQQILQSICDSLDRKSPKKDFQMIGRTSYYGFAERLMNQYMGDRQRPYSPPMNERERQHTQQQQYDRNKNNEKQEVELVYDPVLNCYYDHKTHTYYELKN